MLEVRRNKVKPGMARKRSSMLSPGCCRTSVSSRTVINAGLSVSTRSTTVIVVCTLSGLGSGSFGSDC
jgi:hypothetical protein